MEPPALAGELDHDCSSVLRMLSARDMTFPFECIDDAASRTFVEIEGRRKVLQRDRGGSVEDVDRVRLGDRDIVAANAVPVSKLDEADELGKYVMQFRGRGVARREWRLICGTAAWRGHCCQ